MAKNPARPSFVIPNEEARPGSYGESVHLCGQGVLTNAEGETTVLSPLSLKAVSLAKY